MAKSLIKAYCKNCKWVKANKVNLPKICCNPRASTAWKEVSDEDTCQFHQTQKEL